MYDEYNNNIGELVKPGLDALEVCLVKYRCSNTHYNNSSNNNSSKNDASYEEYNSDECETDRQNVSNTNNKHNDSQINAFFDEYNSSVDDDSSRSIGELIRSDLKALKDGSVTSRHNTTQHSTYNNNCSNNNFQNHASYEEYSCDEFEIDSQNDSAYDKHINDSKIDAFYDEYSNSVDDDSQSNDELIRYGLDILEDGLVISRRNSYPSYGGWRIYDELIDSDDSMQECDDIDIPTYDRTNLEFINHLNVINTNTYHEDNDTAINSNKQLNCSSSNAMPNHISGHQPSPLSSINDNFMDSNSNYLVNNQASLLVFSEAPILELNRASAQYESTALGQAVPAANTLPTTSCSNNLPSSTTFDGTNLKLTGLDSVQNYEIQPPITMNEIIHTTTNETPTVSLSPSSNIIPSSVVTSKKVTTTLTADNSTVTRETSNNNIPPPAPIASVLNNNNESNINSHHSIIMSMPTDPPSLATLLAQHTEIKKKRKLTEIKRAKLVQEALKIGGKERKGQKTPITIDSSSQQPNTTPDKSSIHVIDTINKNILNNNLNIVKAVLKQNRNIEEPILKLQPILSSKMLLNSDSSIKSLSRVAPKNGKTLDADRKLCIQYVAKCLSVEGFPTCSTQCNSLHRIVNKSDIRPLLSILGNLSVSMKTKAEFRTALFYYEKKYTLTPYVSY